METIKKISKQTISKVITCILGAFLAVGALTVQTACVCWFHQPEIPEGMKKFAK